MKKFVISAALLIGLSLSSHVYAGTNLPLSFNIPSTVTIKAIENVKFKFTALNLDKKSLLEIVDAKGVSVYSEYLGRTAAYSKVFDLSNLPDGAYTFVLSSGGERTEKSFEIKTERMAIPTK